MNNPNTTLVTPHDQAFVATGALPPGRHWSAFDVSRPMARKGNASLFATTIWNYHSRIDDHDRRIPTELAISKDVSSGRFWYRMGRPTQSGANKNWVAHWNGLQLALRSGIPIIGVLKDVRTGLCSLTNVFDCKNPQYNQDTGDLWIELHPRNDIGCDTKAVDIYLETGYGPETKKLTDLAADFEIAISTSLGDLSEERLERLRVAQTHPRKIVVSTEVFVRNPDVVAEALFRADGFCQICRNRAPFIRKRSGSPYLEVHHIVTLADGGEDSIENTIAICPNCHRAAHYA